jgi:hypothetical protein
MSTEVAAELAKEIDVPRDQFLNLGDQLIGLANHHATQNKPQAVHLAFLYAVSRYGVFAWRSSPSGKDADPDQFVADMVKRYERMLREQLGDATLEGQQASS